MTAAALEAWLAEQIGRELGVPADEVDPDESFAAFGLDSLRAVGLAGELETLLGQRLPPTLLWDYPTITRLAAHLAAPC
ncbi:MAG: putative phosphopantetheine-binding protein [Cyanobacteria bacterium RYN_339]|nr:putative phosphopantetheine-binding protein [Cyanobacteria bacterium RYN_339]